MGISMKRLFEVLFSASCENEVEKLFTGDFSEILKDSNNWVPLGNLENNFGVIENQQSSPIAALIEKITNSIDAILMRKCYEAGIDPKSAAAPKTMEEALETFWPETHDKSYYKFKTIAGYQREQAKEIQIIADGPKRDTSLVIYDNGEGQHPEDFESTFLSILRGNKNEIQFVQGKYNMGGTGAIVFCGKKRYQLIASKRYDNTGKMGFTLIREHPLSGQEEISKKNTWYEYLKINGEIPSFEINELDLGLEGRNFKTGTIIKLYSYNLPSGNVPINRDLSRSINEYLFEPGLPISLIERKERYPNDNQLPRYIYGLKRRLEKGKEYVEDSFSEECDSKDVGKVKIACYLFKNRQDDKTVKETRDVIQNEFFKNNMAVLFSVNGQVHGFYTSEFISRSLKMFLFKEHLLIHVDCTHVNYGVRKELFMASRDRLKDSAETRLLREELAKILNNSKLKELHKHRREILSLSSGDANDLLKSFTKSLPFNSDLIKLLNNTFKIDQEDNKHQQKDEAKNKHKAPEVESPFKPQRFPSFFKLSKDGTEQKPAAQIPLTGTRSVRFETDVENQYFDRTDEPGVLQISLLSYKPNETQGGTELGEPKQLSDLINLSTASPNNGKIKISMTPTSEVNIGDSVQIQATLKGPNDFEVAFWVKIVEPENPPVPKPEMQEDNAKVGLPQFELIYREKKDSSLSWEEFGEKTGSEMDFDQILHPLLDDEGHLEKIYINMDSSVLLNHKSKLKTPEQLDIAEKKYISSIYFHSLFIFTIMQKKKYDIVQEDKQIDTTEYIKGLFSTSYSEFLLNFGMDELIDSLS